MGHSRPMNPSSFFKTCRPLHTLLIFAAFASGCASTPSAKRSDPAYLFEQACTPGRSNIKVTGSVWMMAKSKDASGQFPASVQAEEPGKLRLEVTNLIGGTEALILIEKNRYDVQLPAKGKGKKSGSRNQSGVGSWGGIPLRWATELFLGRIPCPSAPASALRMTAPEADRLVITEVIDGGTQEIFEYRLRDYAGGLWPAEAAWERTGVQAAKVTFKFEEPGERDRSPKRWEAASDQGEVKVRWKERDALSR